MFFNFHRFFGFGAQLKLDNLLKQDNLTIETIFNEEDILQELKGTNSTKFAEYLISHPLEYRKMIQFVVDEIPDQLTDRNRCIKYPFYTSEILASENEKLISFLFEKPEEQVQEDIKNPLMDQDTEQPEIQEQLDLSKENEVIRANLLNDLLKLLENDAIIITTAGYFSKIVNAIIHKKGHQFWEHLKHNPDIISNMFKHSYLRHIVDIFEKLISLDENTEQPTEYIPERQALLKRLIQFLKGKYQSIIIVQNICEIFVELYKKATNQYETLSQEYKDLLVYFTLITGQPIFFMNLAIQTQQAIVFGVVNAQLDFLNKHFETQFNQDFDIVRLYKPVLGLCLKGLTQTDSLRSSFISSYGQTITPLGDGKLQILQLIYSLLRKPEIHQFIDFNLLNEIIELVKLYPSNNQLHIIFEKIIVSIIDSQDENLHKTLFEDTNILLFIIQNNEEKARVNKYGFQGILTKLSNYINQNIEHSASLKLSIQFLSEIDVDWNEYMKGLEQVNKVEQEWMLGVNPKSTNKILTEIYSPPIQGPVVQFNSQPIPQPQGPPQIRKCTSSDNNDVKPSDDDDVAEIEEDIQQDDDQQNQDNQEQLQNEQKQESKQKVQSEQNAINQEEIIATSNYQEVEQVQQQQQEQQEESPAIEEDIQVEDSLEMKQESIEDVLNRVEQEEAVIHTQYVNAEKQVQQQEQEQEKQEEQQEQSNQQNEQQQEQEVVTEQDTHQTTQEIENKQETNQNQQENNQEVTQVQENNIENVENQKVEQPIEQIQEQSVEQQNEGQEQVQQEQSQQEQQNEII